MAYRDIQKPIYAHPSMPNPFYDWPSEEERLQSTHIFPVSAPVINGLKSPQKGNGVHKKNSDILIGPNLCTEEEEGPDFARHE